MLYLCMEVAGCPTVCRHCWAQGTGYGAMPLAEIEWVLEGAHRFCDDRGLAFDAYPMHEMAAHPDAARLFGLFALVCRPNLDVYSGLAGLYRTRHGNLRTDGMAAVLDRAVAHGRRSDDVLWFNLDPLPPVAELAARFGEADGLGVHQHPGSARYLWLDRAQRQAK